MFDRLVRMQHFGLPTRLLDVTGNPLVALFNATEVALDKDGSEIDGNVYTFDIPPFRNKYFDSDTISCISNLANLSPDEKAEILKNQKMGIEEFNDPAKVPAVDRLVQFIRAEKPSFRAVIKGEELNMSWYVVPKLSNRRIIAQNGAFIIFGLTDRPRSDPAAVRISRARIQIKHEKKEEIRRDLSYLGINESSLFPEIDKAASVIGSRYS